MWVAEEQIVINLWRSKSGQLGKDQVIVLGKGSIAEICPVRAAIVYMRFIGDEDGAFPRHKASSLLTEYQFWKVTSQALRKAGIHSCHFGTH